MIHFILNIQQNIYFYIGAAGFTFRTKSVGSVYGQSSYLNVYLWKGTGSGGGLFVAKVENGVWHTTPSLAYVPMTINDNDWFTLRVNVSGNLANLYLNHRWVADFTIESSYSAGSVGLQTWQVTTLFYSLRIMFPTDNKLYTMNPTNMPSSSPTTLAPTTSSPTTKAPTTSPTTSDPTTSVPTTKAPTTKEPTTKEPTTKAPISNKPVITPTLSPDCTANRK